MNKTDIDWTDKSWNPVTGCLHNCPYCYARRIADRFGMSFAPKLGDPGMEGACKYDSPEGMDTMLELVKPYTRNGRVQAFPMAFLPTFHRYRLGEPARTRKPQTIFVGSMCDLFGAWVPDEWIKAVFKACLAAPQHRYIFLTKNPSRYNDYYSFHDNRPANFYFGASATNYNDMVTIRQTLANSLNFLSIEPIHGFVEIGKFFYENPDSLDWVIVGAETGNRAGKVTPERRWLEEIVDDCSRNGVAVFMKESLRPLWGDQLIQEYPWEGPR